MSQDVKDSSLLKSGKRVVGKIGYFWCGFRSAVAQIPPEVPGLEKVLEREMHKALVSGNFKMRQTPLILTLTILMLNRALGQDTTYFNDQSQLSHCFNPVKSKMVDTTTTTFKTAMQNVLKYCNSNYDFRVDTCAVYYSCREYFSVNYLATDKHQDRYKKEKLTYEFFITLRIRPRLYFKISFILDSALQVKDASKSLTSGAKKIWNIKEWTSISDNMLKYKNGFITPIDETKIDIVWNRNKKTFMYEVEQKYNDKTDYKKTSDYSGSYKVNKLIIDATTGQVIKETTASYRIISDPPW